MNEFKFENKSKDGALKKKKEEELKEFKEFMIS